MVLTLEERRQVARRNGSLSKGALTPQTRRICSRNSLKDGVFARVHDLVDEDPLENARLRAKWFHDEQPTTTAEELLVNECYQGNLMALRYHRAHARALVQQQVGAIEASDKAYNASLESIKNELAGNPEADFSALVATLKTFGFGLFYLIEEWTRLGALVEKRGYWTRDDSYTAVKLMGARPGPESAAERDDVYLLIMLNLQCQPVRAEGYIQSLLEPASRPLGLRDWSVAELAPPPEESREGLKRWIASEVASLQALAEQISAEVDQPNLANLTNLAAILLDPELAKRFQGAASNYRSTYYKAHNTLVASRKSAAAEPKKGAPKNTSKTESRGADKQDDRAAGNDRDAAVVVAPAEPAQASSRIETGSADIGEPVTVSLIAQEGSTGASPKTEVVVEERVEWSTRGIEAEFKNEPTLGVFAPVETPLTPGPEALGRASETPAPAPSVGRGALTTGPRADVSGPASAPWHEAGAAVTTRIQAPAEWNEDRLMTPDEIKAAKEALERKIVALCATELTIEDIRARAADFAEDDWDSSPGVPDEGPGGGEALRSPPGAGSWGW